MLSIAKILVVLGEVILGWYLHLSVMITSCSWFVWVFVPFGAFSSSCDALVCLGWSIRYFQQECERPNLIARKAYLSGLLSTLNMASDSLVFLWPGRLSPHLVEKIPLRCDGTFDPSARKCAFMHWCLLPRTLRRWCCNRFLWLVCVCQVAVSLAVWFVEVSDSVRGETLYSSCNVIICNDWEMTWNFTLFSLSSSAMLTIQRAHDSTGTLIV